MRICLIRSLLAAASSLPAACCISMCHRQCVSERETICRSGAPCMAFAEIRLPAGQGPRSHIIGVRMHAMRAVDWLAPPGPASPVIMCASLSASWLYSSLSYGLPFFFLRERERGGYGLSFFVILTVERQHTRRWKKVPWTTGTGPDRTGPGRAELLKALKQIKSTIFAKVHLVMT